MIVDNREAVFQVVKRGIFIAPLVSRPVTLELGRLYEFEVISSRTTATLFIDGVTVLSVELPQLIEFGGKSLAMILFEKDSVRTIEASIYDARINV